MDTHDTADLQLMTVNQGSGSQLFGQKASKCPPSQDASTVDLCGVGDIVDPLVVKNGGAAALLAPPPANPILPSVTEIESSPGAADARKAFQAIIDKDWPAAIASYKQALLKDPSNAALKRSLDLAEYTQARRVEIERQNSPIF